MSASYASNLNTSPSDDPVNLVSYPTTKRQISILPKYTDFGSVLADMNMNVIKKKIVVSSRYNIKTLETTLSWSKGKENTIRERKRKNIISTLEEKKQKKKMEKQRKKERWKG